MIITFTLMLVPICLNLYYFLNMFYCANVTKVNRTRIGSWAWRSSCLLLLLLWLGLIVLWLYIRIRIECSTRKAQLKKGEVSRRKYEICVWKITHFGIKYFPLTIITLTVMFVPLRLNLYYFQNMFYCTNVTKVNRTRIGSWAWRSTCLLLWLLLWLGLLVLWRYISYWMSAFILEEKTLILRSIYFHESSNCEYIPLKQVKWHLIGFAQELM